jgi:hypothetical protein
VRLLAALALAGCASFEDPTIVLDLRVLGVETTPPEQVLDVDPMKAPTIDEVLVQLVPIRVRALVADPYTSADIHWTMTACLLDEGSRCDPEAPSFEFAGGVLSDPESSVGFDGTPCKGDPFEDPGTVCGLLVPDNRLVQMLFAALEGDPTGGLGGIDVGIVLRVRNPFLDPPAETFAAKHIRFAPRVPLDRRPNNNPHIDQLLLGRGGFGAELTKEYCAEPGSVMSVDAGDVATLFPVSRETDKEEYVLPTLDGQSERFQEYLTYQWIATAGSFVDEVTGGPPDVFGNIRLDGTEWKAPDVDADTLVTVWVIQRDSRYGVRWRQGCIKVEPL